MLTTAGRGRHVLSDCIDGRNQRGRSSPCLAVQHAMGPQRGVLGNTVGRTANRSSDMSPVAVKVVAVVIVVNIVTDAGVRQNQRRRHAR